MNIITNYKEYKRIEYRSGRGIEILLLTDNDVKRLQERTRKQGLIYYKLSLWGRILWAIRYIIRG